MNIAYEKSIKKLMSLANFENTNNLGRQPKLNLERITKLLKYSNNPQTTLKSIHIAGTNGKGSTCAIIASVLKGSGLKVGLFISPSIHKITERIQINGEPISENNFAEELNNIWPHIIEMSKNNLGNITFFEAINVMALNYFKKRSVDMAVIEVGLGGRLDSTNVISPLLTVITPISMDHMDILGTTIKKIALEKAGIIKKGIPVILAKQSSNVEKIIKEFAENLGAPVYQASNIAKIKSIKNLIDKGSEILFNTKNGNINCICPLIGKHQIDNTCTAIATLTILTDMNFNIPINSLEHSIKKVKWPARFQILKKLPYSIVVDGAHNKNSVESLIDTLKYSGVNTKNPILIFGSGYGHDTNSVVKQFIKLNPKIILTKSRHPKSIPVIELKKITKKYKLNIIGTENNTTSAMNLAKKIIKNNEIIIATGSLFIAGEIIEIVNNLKKEIYN